MNSRILPIITSGCFFAAAACFLVFAFNLNKIWLICAVILLLAGIVLRRLAPAQSRTEKKLEEISSHHKEKQHRDFQ